jgi:hypothetical protein
MPRHDRPTAAAEDWQEHPIAWFAALLRAEDRCDQRTVHEALANLNRLGYIVVPIPPKPPDRKGVSA